jgi:hypothetical protein
MAPRVCVIRQRAGATSSCPSTRREGRLQAGQHYTMQQLHEALKESAAALLTADDGRTGSG